MIKINLIKKGLCVILSVILILPELVVEKSFAETLPVISRLIYVDPIQGLDGDLEVDITEMINEAQLEPSYYYSDSDRLHPWPVLRNRDHLNPGEIHLRVQCDIWNRSENGFSDDEKREQIIYYDDVEDTIKGKYVDKAYGRADIWKNINDTTYIWEVKPPSYLNEKKQLGINQLQRYVEHGIGNFDYGINCPWPIDFSDAHFQFNLILDFTRGSESWIEYVT